MARQIDRLTPLKVRHAKPGLHPDGGGLYMRVTAGKTTGALNKSWLFGFELAGRERKIGLRRRATSPGRCRDAVRRVS